MLILKVGECSAIYSPYLKQTSASPFTSRKSRTRVLGLSASMLAGWNSHQTTPGPGATVQKSRDSLAVQSPILAGWCNASVRTPIMLPKNRKPDLLKGQEMFNKQL